MPPRTIAILGGGLTGLSSAFHLSRKFPAAQIFLLEKQKRLGGWVQSERVQLPQIHASVLLEGGPRTLRPNGKSVLELVNLLRLEDKVIKILKTAPPARSRFLFIPESFGGTPTGLQRLPSSFFTLFSSPLLSDIFSAVIFDLFKGGSHPRDITDESVHSFVSRRFGDTFELIFGSALVHGIYAADSRQLSVKAAFPYLWHAEKRGRGSVIRGLLTPVRLGTGNDSYELGHTDHLMQGVSVYSFKDGMSTLTDALERYLHALPNVTIIKGTRILNIRPCKDSTIEILHTAGNSISATHAVSALPLPILQDLVPSVPHLLQNPSSTVHVLNLVFSCPPSKIHPEGFGYLIPRPRTGYPAESGSKSPGILGVVFDSCSLSEQDSPAMPDYYHNSTHTKLTVMMGGPYPLLDLPSTLTSSTNKDLPIFVRSVLDELQFQLGCKLPDPIYWRIWENKACIPTFVPGHVERVQEIQSCVKDSPEWGGRLCIIGAGIGGVSVPDCVEASRQVGKDWITVPR